MDKYFADQPIQIEIPITSDLVASATLVSYSVGMVSPEIGTTVIGSFDPQTASNMVTLNLTEHPAIATTSIFEVVYTLQSATGDFTYRFNFMVAPGDALVVGENSYQNYLTAILTAEGLAGVDSFKTAAKSDQQAALIHAYNILNTMVYTDQYDEYYDLGALDEAELLALEPAFLQALKIAQVIEANEMLDANSLHNKRQDGLMSETIGESSMMFRPGNINNYPVTRRSLMFLRNYVIVRARLRRG